MRSGTSNLVRRTGDHRKWGSSTGSPGVSIARMSCHVFVDFDGTIVSCDATDYLLERFAAPQWRDIEQVWQAGRIGSRECLARQTSLLRATPAELDAAVDEIDVDPGFASFLRFCRERGISATIVSDGFDRVIARVLRRHGIVLPAAANRLEPVGADGWRLSFPHASDDCLALAGHCKCATAARNTGLLKVVVGDGRSDYCLAGTADLVLAKSALRDMCVAGGKAHTPFHDFYDVAGHLSEWLAARDSPASGPINSPRAVGVRAGVED